MNNSEKVREIQELRKAIKENERYIDSILEEQDKLEKLHIDVEEQERLGILSNIVGDETAIMQHLLDRKISEII